MAPSRNTTGSAKLFNDFTANSNPQVRNRHLRKCWSRHCMNRSSPIIQRLRARSRKMAAVFFPHSNFAFRLRNFIMRNMPKRLLGWYFSGAIKA
jgi:hypothetical protein